MNIFLLILHFVPMESQLEMRTVQKLNSLALKLRREWGEDSYLPIDIFATYFKWKEELFLDVFRADIVFNLEDEGVELND